MKATPPQEDPGGPLICQNKRKKSKQGKIFIFFRFLKALLNVQPHIFSNEAVRSTLRRNAEFCVFPPPA